MPLQQTSGAASYDAFGGGAPVATKYIEDFFQTWLRTGTGSSATVTTGLNGSINETMVWTKSRSAATNHKLTDNVRGATKALSSNTTGAEVTDSQGLTAFSATGYTIGTNTDYNNSGATYVDWQFVATPKFFDVVTWTGNGVAGRQIPHNLGSVPGCIFVKNLELGTNWIVYHRGANGGVNPEQYYANLDRTNQFMPGGEVVWGDGTTAFPPTSTYFTVYNSNDLNRASNLNTYVAYVLAHNAGGFGLTGTDNVISCGSFTTDGSGNATVNLGYEPQMVITKRSSGAADWMMFDNMRGFSQTGLNLLYPNLSNAEDVYTTGYISPTATGFNTPTAGQFFASSTYIYIAIRRGPMKVPTDGTKVFAPNYFSTPTDNQIVTTNFPADFVLEYTNQNGQSRYVSDRLRGSSVAAFNWLVTNTTAAEATGASFGVGYDSNTSIVDNWLNPALGGNGGHYQALRRAPGFFDEVCYTGTGVARNVTHNLGVAPELLIIKQRNTSTDWWVIDYPINGNLQLNSNYAVNSPIPTNLSTGATSTTFSVGNYSEVNGSGGTFVAYLFASCAGVSKVGTYTGTGATQTISCGFTGGARFVIVKRTDDTGGGIAGNWWIWDTAYGMVSGNSNATALNTGLSPSSIPVYTTTGGFQIATNSPEVNASGGSYIFLAIA